MDSCYHVYCKITSDIHQKACSIPNRRRMTLWWVYWPRIGNGTVKLMSVEWICGSGQVVVLTGQCWWPLWLGSSIQNRPCAEAATPAKLICCVLCALRTSKRVAPTWRIFANRLVNQLSSTSLVFSSDHMTWAVGWTSAWGQRYVSFWRTLCRSHWSCFRRPGSRIQTFLSNCPQEIPSRRTGLGHNPIYVFVPPTILANAKSPIIGLLFSNPGTLSLNIATKIIL